MQRNFRIALANNFYSEPVHLSQYDTNYNIVFEVMEKTSKAPINGMTAYFEGTRCDGLSFRYSGTASDNFISFTIDTALTAVSGRHTGEIVLYDGSGLWFGSANVQIFVEKAARPNNAIDADVEEARSIAEQIQEIVDTAAEAAVDESVKNWLDEHPEATTTVEDGSLTYKKLVTGTLGFVIPQMYGAVGDGVTDDTESFNLACQSGKPVYVPSGNYLIDSVLSNNADLIGGIMPLSNTTIIMSNDANLIVKPNASAYYSVFYLLRVKNVLIKGGNIIGDRETHTFDSGTHEWGHAIKCVGCENIIIDNVNISKTTGDAIDITKILASDQSKNITIKNCNINDARRNGISIEGASNIKITDNVIQNVSGVNPQQGIVLEPNNIANDYVSDVIISGNSIKNCANGGVNCWKADNVTVAHNNIDVPNNKAPVCVLSSSGTQNNNILVSDNVLSCNDGTGIYFVGNSAITANNHFENITIYLTWSNVLTILNAVFTNNKANNCLFKTAYGNGNYTVMCKNVTISNNIFTYTFTGTDIDASASTIDGLHYEFGTRDVASGKKIKGIEIIDNIFEYLGVENFITPTTAINNKFSMTLGLIDSRFNGNILKNLPRAIYCADLQHVEIKNNKFYDVGFLWAYRAFSITNSTSELFVFAQNTIEYDTDTPPNQIVYVQGLIYAIGNTMIANNPALDCLFKVQDGTCAFIYNNFAKGAATNGVVSAYTNQSSVTQDNNIS